MHIIEFVRLLNGDIGDEPDPPSTVLLERRSGDQNLDQDERARQARAYRIAIHCYAQGKTGHVGREEHFDCRG